MTNVAPTLCPHDLKPCYVGPGTDDAHYRCGTSACHRPDGANRPLVWDGQRTVATGKPTVTEIEDWMDIHGNDSVHLRADGTAEFIDWKSRALAAEARASALEVQVEGVKIAAQAVVDRWDTPLWKDVEPTGNVVNRLRQALAALQSTGLHGEGGKT